MTIMEKIRMRNRIEPELEREVSDVLLESLREANALERPADEFAPPRLKYSSEYSLDRVVSLLSRHIKELDETQSALEVQANAAREHLAEVERRRTVTSIARSALAETVGKLAEKAAALDQPKLPFEPAPATTEEAAS
ncbi:MAG TPA: hypothetical protein VGQ19_21070 [Burkholderiales bacterium]|jgi:hypothetical protein|nr:hypothetical protein [Burkholderiales bacterium]